MGQTILLLASRLRDVAWKDSAAISPIEKPPFIPLCKAPCLDSEWASQVDPERTFGNVYSGQSVTTCCLASHSISLACALLSVVCVSVVSVCGFSECSFSVCGFNWV